MNTSKLLFLVICLVALTLTAPLVTAAPRGGSGFSGGHHFASMPARGGQTFTRSGAGNFRTFNDRRFVNNRFVNNRFVNNRFFFSSRRRHTRCSRDWSSDVCSSD